MSIKPDAPAIGQIELFTKGSEVTGKQFNLKGQLISFEIFEGLNQPNYSSQVVITVLDPDNILYPNITGNELVLIAFKSAFNKENENFVKVYQTVEVEKFLDDQNRQCVIIHCRTPYNIVGKMVYFQKVFPDISSKECLEQVTQQIEKGFSSYQVNAKYNKNFEESLFKRPFNVPSRNWEWIIDYWVKNSVQSGNHQNQTLFYFWDDKNGLNFKQNRSLIKENPKHMLLLMKNKFSPLVQHGIIHRFEITEQTSVENQLYNKTVQPFVVDLSTSNFALGQNTAVDKINDNIKQSQEEVFKNDLLGQTSNRVFVPLNYATEWKLMGTQLNDTTVKTNITNQIYEDTTYTTYALAEIAGDVEICPGDLVNIARIDRNGVIDTQDSSIWLIRQIKHTVTYDRYIQTLELMK